MFKPEKKDTDKQHAVNIYIFRMPGRKSVSRCYVLYTYTHAHVGRRAAVVVSRRSCSSRFYLKKKINKNKNKTGACGRPTAKASARAVQPAQSKIVQTGPESRAYVRT